MAEDTPLDIKTFSGKSAPSSFPLAVFESEVTPLKDVLSALKDRRRAFLICTFKDLGETARDIIFMSTSVKMKLKRAMKKAKRLSLHSIEQDKQIKALSDSLRTVSLSAMGSAHNGNNNNNNNSSNNAGNMDAAVDSGYPQQISRADSYEGDGRAGVNTAVATAAATAAGAVMGVGIGVAVSDAENNASEKRGN
jgi:hypothetical protein